MKKRANPDSEPNIRRIDSKPKSKKQTHGFQVHFLRGTQSVTRMFSDTIFGGKEGARRAARKFRNEQMGELPERVFRGGETVRRGSGGARGAKKSAATKSSGKTSTARGRSKAAVFSRKADRRGGKRR